MSVHAHHFCADVIKVRQQQAGASSRNVLVTGVQVVRSEGLLALYKGVSAAVARGMLYGGLRIGLYGPIKHALGVSSSESGLIRKIAAGMLGGALAAGVCNPTDLIKTRLQAQGSTLRGPFAVLGSVIRHEGVRGLWKGTTPSMARAALLTAAQCATYDEVKLLFVRNLGWEDTLGTHFAGSEREWTGQSALPVSRCCTPGFSPSLVPHLLLSEHAGWAGYFDSHLARRHDQDQHVHPHKILGALGVHARYHAHAGSQRLFQRVRGVEWLQTSGVAGEESPQLC